MTKAPNSPPHERNATGLYIRPFARALGIALIALGLSVVPARAQIASYVDQHGNLVYINANDPAKKPPEKPVTPASKPAPQPGAAPASPAAPAASATTPKPAAPAASPAPPAAPPAELDQLVQQTAEKHNVDPQLVRAVIATESNWNSSAVSRRGAMGLMQLIPDTAIELGVNNAFDPEQNVEAGVRYLGMLLERYNFDFKKALAAYNAGPSVVDRVGGVPNYPETRHYVEKVTSNYLQPGPDGQSRAWGGSHPIYRTTDAAGRVVFTNE